MVGLHYSEAIEILSLFRIAVLYGSFEELYNNIIIFLITAAKVAGKKLRGGGRGKGRNCVVCMTVKG